MISKFFANSWPSGLNFKSFSQSLEFFFLTVSQNNFGNKIPIYLHIILNMHAVQQKLNFFVPELRVRLVLVFAKKKTEFLLIAKHWLSWLPVNQKLRWTILKNLNTCCCLLNSKHRVTGEENSNSAVSWKLYIRISSTEPPLTFYMFSCSE